MILVLSQSISAQVSPALADISGLIEAGQYQQALLQLDNTLSSDKRHPLYMFHRARALEGAGQMDKAIAQYKALIKLQPTLPELYNNLALIYIQQGQMQKAQTLLNQAMMIHPGYSRVYKNLVAINAAQARDAYAKALQMPTASQAKGLEVADTLSFVEEPIPASQAEPIVAAVTKPHIKPGMVYQANGDHADKRTERVEKESSVSKVEVSAAQAILLNWAKAWSTQNVDQYIRFYSDDYSPAGMSRTVWAAQRKKRIRQPKWIHVGLRNFDVTENGPARLRIRLEQEYKADNYRDVTRKEFILQKIDNEWRIIKERGLGYIGR